MTQNDKISTIHKKLELAINFLSELHFMEKEFPETKILFLNANLSGRIYALQDEKNNLPDKFSTNKDYASYLKKLKYSLVENYFTPLFQIANVIENPLLTYKIDNEALFLKIGVAFDKLTDIFDFSALSTKLINSKLNLESQDNKALFADIQRYFINVRLKNLPTTNDFAKDFKVLKKITDEVITIGATDDNIIKSVYSIAYENTLIKIAEIIEENSKEPKVEKYSKELLKTIQKYFIENEIGISPNSALKLKFNDSSYNMFMN